MDTEHAHKEECLSPQKCIKARMGESLYQSFCHLLTKKVLPIILHYFFAEVM